MFGASNFGRNGTIITSMQLDVTSVFDSIKEIPISESCPVGAHLREINARLQAGRPLLDALNDHFTGERFALLRFNAPRTIKNQIRRELFEFLRPILVVNPVAEYVLDRFFRSFRFNVKRREVGTVLTLEELGQCIMYSGERTSLWFEFLYYFGGRVTEACNIRMTDIRKTARPDDTVIVVREGKTDAAASVLVPTEVVKRILAVFDSRVFLFESSTGRKYNRRTVYNLLVDASVRILGRRVTPHDMRRTFGHQMLTERPELEEQTVRHGRWSDRNTFRRCYTRPAPLRPDEIPQPEWDGVRRGYRALERKSSVRPLRRPA